MRDIDNAAAAVPEHIDDLEQVLHLGLRQGGGGLVKYDHLGVEGDGLGNLHHLPLGHGHGAHNRFRIDADAQVVEDLHGGIVHFLFTGEGACHGEAAKPHIVHDVALQRLVQFLVYHGNAVLQGFLGVLEVDLLALQIDVTGILGVNAKEAFHQSGLTGAVFAHQGMDRTGPHGQIDTVQSLDTGEFLGNALHAQQDGFAVLIQIVRLLSWGTRPGKASWARSGSARKLSI